MTIYSVKNGLLEMTVDEFKALNLVDLLCFYIRSKSWPNATGSELQSIHRASRMCYELKVNSCLTMVDRTDAQILYDLPITLDMSWLNSTLNKVMVNLRDTGDVLTMADHFAKSVHVMMES